MRMSEFLADHMGQLLLRAVFAGAAVLFLLATGTAPGVAVLLLIVWLPVFTTSQVVDYLRQRARLQELEGIMDGLDKQYLFAELAPRGRTVYERRLLDFCRRAGRAMATQVSEAQAAQREYREYVESWVHEVKTPITAAGLICRNAEPEFRRRLAQELAQIEAHVERALFYARAESLEKDFILRESNLSDIVSQAVGQHRTLLIQSGVRMETEDLEQTVFTDGKWAAFILGQLLQNAARYRGNQPLVTLSGRQLGRQVQLTVSDSGIGIPAHELPRIFDRGFTGSNGRARGGSTGMGLYLCKKLADCLDIGLRVASEVNEGTSVTLTFPSRENLTKV